MVLSAAQCCFFHGEQMWDWDMLSRNDYMGESAIGLADLADGCVQQHVEFRPSTLRQKGKRKDILFLTCATFYVPFLFSLPHAHTRTSFDVSVALIP
jgi:hypothetical protein